MKVITLPNKNRLNTRHIEGYFPVGNPVGSKTCIWFFRGNSTMTIDMPIDEFDRMMGAAQEEAIGSEQQITVPQEVLDMMARAYNFLALYAPEVTFLEDMDILISKIRGV